MSRPRLTQDDYTALAEFRYLLRSFLEFSENAAKKAGLTPRQHQALLVIKGYRHGSPIAVGDLAERLKIRHNTAVELASRLVESVSSRHPPTTYDTRRRCGNLSQCRVRAPAT